MTDYEHFLKHKEALTKALEDAIMKTLSTMTVEEINQIPWFNNRMWECPETLK